MLFEALGGIIFKRKSLYLEAYYIGYTVLLVSNPPL